MTLKELVEEWTILTSEGKNGEALSLQTNSMGKEYINSSAKLLAERKGVSLTLALLLNMNPKVFLSIGFSAKHIQRSFL